MERPSEELKHISFTDWSEGDVDAVWPERPGLVDFDNAGNGEVPIRNDAGGRVVSLCVEVLGLFIVFIGAGDPKGGGPSFKVNRGMVAVGLL
jgi:hypothetical protein